MKTSTLRDMLEASFQNTSDTEWEAVPRILVGNIPSGLGTPQRFVAVRQDQRPLLRIDVYVADEATGEVIIWGDYVVALFGDSVFFVSLRTHQVTSLRFDDEEDYVFYLHPVGDHLLLVTDHKILCLSTTLQTIWRSEELGIDGVLIDDVKGGTIYGQGEWDPPGGWKPFKLDLATGLRKA